MENSNIIASLCSGAGLLNLIWSRTWEIGFDNENAKVILKTCKITLIKGRSE